MGNPKPGEQGGADGPCWDDDCRGVVRLRIVNSAWALVCPTCQQLRQCDTTGGARIRVNAYCQSCERETVHISNTQRCTICGFKFVDGVRP